VSVMRRRHLFFLGMLTVLCGASGTSTAQICSNPGSLSILETNDQIQLSFAGPQPVEVSPDLIEWTAIGQQNSPYIDTNAAVLGKRFYRLHCEDAFSSNIVGFYRLNIPAGFSLIGNHLRLANERIVEIFSAPPDGTQVYPFNPPTGGYVLLQYVDGAWEGDDVNATLPPGRGVFIVAPQAFSKTMVGEVILNSTNRLLSGFTVPSSMLPQSLPLTGSPGLNFPAAEGDQIFQYNPVTGGYRFSQYIDGQWEGDSGGNPPVPALGESFFVFKNSPALWIQQRSVGP
jgi:hypothetical protein